MPTRARIEGLLSALYRVRVQVCEVERVEPWAVLRCHLAATSSAVPSSIVVKWLRDNPNDVRRDPAQLSTERAALEFLAGVDSTLTPRLLAADTAGTDPRCGFLALEDVAPREPLRAILLRQGARDSAALLTSFARSLGRLHIQTMGRADDYYTRRRRLGFVDRQADLERFFGDWRTGVRHVHDAGVEMTTAASNELAGVVAELINPGAFLAFSNGDPGVNNYLVDGAGDGRLIDFEAAGFRHALSDLVNDLYLPGSMWLTVGDPMSNGVEDAYRNTVAPVVPDVADDRRFGHALAGAAFLFAASRLSSLPRMDIRPLGDHSRLHRIATLQAAADTAERHQCLPHLTGWARTAGQALRRRWPDADVDLEALDPYTTRQ